MQWLDPTTAADLRSAIKILSDRTDLLKEALAPPTEAEPEPPVAAQYAYPTLVYSMFGPVQPSETGGSFKYYPSEVGAWHHGGQMFTGWNLNLYFGPNGGGQASHPEIVQARWQLVWLPSSSHIKARICCHAMNPDDPAGTFNMQEIAVQDGEDGVGPVPRGKFITSEMEALRLNGWPKYVLTQFYMDRPGEYALLTKSTLELTIKVRV